MPEEAGVETAARGEGAREGADAAPGRGVLPLRVQDVQFYHLGECLTELLIYAMVIFSPWAFGTTEEWSMRTMNIGGYALGALLAIKLGIRWLKGYRPPRWDDQPRVSGHSHAGGQGLPGRTPMAVLAGLTVCLLAYCWVSAWNARCYIDPETFLPAYRDNYIKWLPYSLDGNASWAAFRNYLALACSFWAIVDWLPGKTASEERGQSHAARRHRSGSGSDPRFPARLRRLLWVLAINGGLLAVEGIVQRLEESPLLLFLVRPRYSLSAVSSQFGPWAYRSNAGQYFNLLWPVCAGFWWALNRRSGSGQAGHHLVLICALAMAACPIIATSRAGTILAAAMLVLAPLCLLAVQWWDGAVQRWDGRRKGRRGRGQAATWALLLFSVLALGLGFGLGWKPLKLRFQQMEEDYQDREAMYNTARPMAADYPVFGTGPGTFGTVFQFYRRPEDLTKEWYPQLHNDWLETRVTFGWVGSALIALAFLTVLLRWFGRGGIHAGRRFMVLLWLSLAGCLVWAQWDFPFQIYSVLFLALVICAIAASLTRRV